jgi:hypothetical protein
LGEIGSQIRTFIKMEAQSRERILGGQTFNLDDLFWFSNCKVAA